MKGIINRGFQEFIETRFGPEKWNEIKSRAGCEEPFFSISLDYPDAMTMALVKAGCEVLDLEPETAMVEFGKFVVPNTLKKYYPVYFSLAGNSPRDFLLNMNRIHTTVTRSIPNARPPRLDFEDRPDGRLLIHYRSKRQLCSVLHGLILGVGVLFNQDLQIREAACMLKGDPQCTFEVTFP
jgi:predicted hydrocarbon binding protein